jgi:putative addiction module killer protein
MKVKEFIIYKTQSGKEPYTEWIESLDIKGQARIQSRLDRVECGNYGDCDNLKDGVFELRFITHAGYRIYFAEDGEKIVVLLTGGGKKSQNKDIQKAKEYWNDYKERKDK